MMSYKSKLIILTLFKEYTLSLSTLRKLTVPSICSLLVTHLQKSAPLRSLWKFLLLADILDLVLYTLNETYSTKKLGRDVGLQNTHIVLFKSPRAVHQVATLNVQLGLGSSLVD